MEILIVTCNRDRWLLELQSISLKYITPCKINIVINEEDPRSWLEWFETIKYNYNKFELKVYTRDIFDYFNNFKNIPGWVSQQLIKLYFSQLTIDNYLILDSKNFFIKSTNINKITNTYRVSNTDNYSFYKLKHLLGHASYISPETPFIINSKYAKMLISKSNFESWFLNLPEFSEFIVYDAFLQDNNLEIELGHSMCINIWYDDEIDYKKWCAIETSIIGLHPYFIKINANIDWQKWLADKKIKMPNTEVPKLKPLDWSMLCG